MTESRCRATDHKEPDQRRFIFIRHAESAGADGKCIGQTDLDITDEAQRQLSLFSAGKGKLHAELMGAVRYELADGCGTTEGLPKQSEDRCGNNNQRIKIISSDLRRAHKTAKAIAGKFGVTIELDSRLREINFGEWDGMDWEEIARIDGATLENWFLNWQRITPPKGESFAAFLERVRSSIQMLAQVDENVVIVVSHAGWIKAAMCMLLSLPISEMFSLVVNPLSVTEVPYQVDIPSIPHLECTVELYPSGGQAF